MGVQDREYMRRGPAASQTRRTAGPSEFAAPAEPAWLQVAGYVSVAVLVVGFMMLGTREFLGPRLRSSSPFPETGAVHWYTTPAETVRAHFAVGAPAKSSLQYVVRLDDWASGRPILMVPVRAGETARVEVPLGRYRATIIKGRNWQGPGRYFATDLHSSETVHPVEFYRVGNTVTGFSMQLDSGTTGNLQTQPARP